MIPYQRRLRLTALFLAAFLGLGAASAPIWTITYAYVASEDALMARLGTNQVLKDIFRLSGETAWAAYYAGRESVLQEQLDELRAHPFLVLTPPNQN